VLCKEWQDDALDANSTPVGWMQRMNSRGTKVDGKMTIPKEQRVLHKPMSELIHNYFLGARCLTPL
jgi:hypothetical protein